MDSLRLWPDERVGEAFARAAGTPSENDVNDLVAEVFRLRDVLTKEAAARGYWAGEASRLLLIVENRQRLRDEAVAAEREACAELAEDEIVRLAHWKRIGETVAAAIRARK